MSTFWWKRDNLWNEIQYETEFEKVVEVSTRRLVPEVREWDREIGVYSPVGEVLRRADVGAVMDVQVPDGIVVVKVLSVV